MMCIRLRLHCLWFPDESFYFHIVGRQQYSFFYFYAFLMRTYNFLIRLAPPVACIKGKENRCFFFYFVAIHMPLVSADENLTVHFDMVAKKYILSIKLMIWKYPLCRENRSGANMYVPKNLCFSYHPHPYLSSQKPQKSYKKHHNARSNIKWESSIQNQHW